ncbi:uncharacterized protein EV154DRAFT_429655 [Mucor mucedo]|uniref:uncharacterized protein n=1 Tax=Mucor mucedo TaxID=29922 RepID=UPI0022204754|nr:uncharacterized protein EV154DRAFT_429655 [Mucor mucedo]KAI7876632.1 hypothetical protein EV154DRAFT_429655 [Mucor mucedo]
MTDIVEPKFLVHQATHLFLTDPIFFQVTQMNNSIFVWIGKPDGKMGDMSVAVPAFASQTTASATTIMGTNVSEKSKNLAPSKYKLQFYVSMDLSSPDDLLFVFVEKKLTELLKNVLA